ncbi:MAG: methyltransferase family protein, partial [Planctomycetota bacterium]
APPAPVPPILIAVAAIAGALMFPLLLFLPAGRLNWTLGWIYVGLMLISMGVNSACLLRWNPELIQRRMHIGQGTKTWDKVWLGLWAPLVIAVPIVAGFEVRYGLAGLPGAAWPLGLAIFTPGTAMLTWSMVANPFFEKTVRIQTDHGHHVIDTGPYALVRHPGYVGFSAMMLSTPLLLASAWAFLPAVLSVLGMTLRTALEDRALHAELPGYPEYAARVRFRLFPGIW